MISCVECDAECCNSISITFQKTETEEELDTIKWFVAHEGVEVRTYAGSQFWILSVATPCTQLGKENLCNIHQDKPDICNTFQPNICMKNNELAQTMVPDLLFNSIDDVEKYMKGKNNGKKH